MGSSLTKRLASLSTASKLMLGFALVLLLTALVAATGLLALREVSAGAELQQRMSALGEQVLRMRQSEQAFALAGDSQHAERLNEQADAILQASQALQGELDSDSAAILAQVEPALADYRTAFARYVELTDNMQLSLQAADWLVVAAANSLDLLQEGLSEDGVDLLKSSQGERGGDSVLQAGQVGKIHQLLLQALDQARQRLEASRRADTTEQAEIAQAGEAQALAAELRDALDDPGYSAVLGEVVVNVDSFNERLQEYASQLQQQKAVYAQLVAQVELLLQRVDQALQAQQQAMQAERKASSGLIVVAAALALLFGLAAAIIISLVIVRPLKRVIALAESVAGGDLSVHLEQDRRDEIGQLLAAMQRMAGNLRDMVGRLQGGVAQISNSAQSLSATAEQTRQGVNGQKLETDQVATAMSEMTATVHEVARNAEAAAASTEQADQRVGNGSQVVRQTLQRIEQLARAMDTTTASIQRLSQDTQRIDAVLEVIKSVAEQTNLLALNAAIEAARAGEQGRGFAVVADEVRALAKRTQQSTAEIESLISALREGSRRAVADMEQSAGLVEKTVDDASQTEVALVAIAEAVTLISEMNQQIAAAAEQQTAVAEEINRSVTSIRDIADQSATAMDETAASSIQLAELGRELQGMAGHFRL
ncbi:Methyl-accepting chemotaxis protein McpS [Pseudomonas sp. THAF187a]|uniref:methyl-accepting chemotaxis protein n=1 Tax=Ectopseudomonas khazarica TaxID=2502979 RepID=UPI00055D0A70|nr:MULTISPECIES: methyl-accepting chemotaxis protein [Pseudomonas]QFT22144.1 Methyl-accepting chemotaxis protein McpS [Pseudomonas sp. THAF187a]QFT42331.1 Methyl-accepting chemotaxis protein McpS [Pseudomonas sp. THAF42]QTS88759.1 methyl-accepting chemotaxis protein [Pseudomonas khazarica]